MSGERGGLLSAGGILSLTIGIAQVIFGLLAVLLGLNVPLWLPSLPYIGDPFSVLKQYPVIAIIIGASLILLGKVAILGGRAAIKRSSFGLALAGAICALPSGTLGVLAVIFVSLAKGEFRQDN